MKTIEHERNQQNLTKRKKTNELQENERNQTKSNTH